MKSEIITVDSHGTGFPDVIREAKKVAEYGDLTKREFLHLQLLTEEMLSLVNSLSEDIQCTLWFECENRQYNLHLTTKTVLDKEMRYRLISSSSSGKNEAANTFLGRLRDRFEYAIASDGYCESSDLPSELMSDLPADAVDDPEWDGYERSILRNVADDVKISIRRGVVDMTVSKKYA